MAQINFKEPWWTDKRRYALAEILPVPLSVVERVALADGIMASAWRLSQDFWKHGKSPIPSIIYYEKVLFPDAVLAAGLAKKIGKFIYIRGSRENHRWIAEAVSNGAKGGKSKGKRAYPNSTEPLPNGYLITTLIPTPTSKEERETELPPKEFNSDLITQCYQEWVDTLSRFGVTKANPVNDKFTIAKAINRHGFDDVRDAIVGKRFERRDAKYDPARTLSLQYIFKETNISRLANNARVENLKTSQALAEDPIKKLERETKQKLEELNDPV